MHPLSKDHKEFCSSFALYQKILLRQKSYGRIKIALPHRVLKKTPIFTDNVEDTLRLLYKNITAFQDDCVNAALMQIATFPLTALYLYQKAGMELKEQLVIHLVGKSYLMF